MPTTSQEITKRGDNFSHIVWRFGETNDAHDDILRGSFCNMRGIYAGFRMEINANGQRTVTTAVKSIGVLA